MKLALIATGVLALSLSAQAQTDGQLEAPKTLQIGDKSYFVCPEDTTALADEAIEATEVKVDKKAEAKLKKEAEKKAKLVEKMMNYKFTPSGAQGFDDFNKTLIDLINNTYQLKEDSKRFKMEIWCTNGEDGELEHMVRFLDITQNPPVAVAPKVFEEYNLALFNRSLEYVSASMNLVASSLGLATDVMSVVSSNPLLALSLPKAIADAVDLCKFLDMEVKATSAVIKEQKETYETYKREYGETWKEEVVATPAN